MTDKQIIKNNKLIANFMGYEYIPFNNPDKKQPGWWLKDSKIQSYKVPNSFLGRSHTRLKYHSSWDWAMLVRHKIHSHGGYIIIAKNVVILQYKFGSTSIRFENDNQLESTWVAVVEFIKFYNNNFIS